MSLLRPRTLPVFSATLRMSESAERQLAELKGWERQPERDRVVEADTAATMATLTPKLEALRKRGLVTSWEVEWPVVEIRVPRNRVEAAGRELERLSELDGVHQLEHLGHGLYL